MKQPHAKVDHQEEKQITPEDLERISVEMARQIYTLAATRMGIDKKAVERNIDKFTFMSWESTFGTMLRLTGICSMQLTVDARSEAVELITHKMVDYLKQDITQNYSATKLLKQGSERISWQGKGIETKKAKEIDPDWPLNDMWLFFPDTFYGDGCCSEALGKIICEALQDKYPSIGLYLLAREILASLLDLEEKKKKINPEEIFVLENKKEFIEMIISHLKDHFIPEKLEPNKVKEFITKGFCYKIAATVYFPDAGLRTWFFLYKRTNEKNYILFFYKDLADKEGQLKTKVGSWLQKYFSPPSPVSPVHQETSSKINQASSNSSGYFWKFLGLFRCGKNKSQSTSALNDAEKIKKLN